MGFSDPVDLPEHGESGLVSVGIFEDLRYYWWVHSAKSNLARTKKIGGGWSQILFFMV